MKKRILATLLSLCLVAGLLPVTAMAEESDMVAESCTVTEGCTLPNDHEGECAVMEDNQEEITPGTKTEDCTVTQGCTLTAGHEGECNAPVELKLADELETLPDHINALPTGEDYRTMSDEDAATLEETAIAADSISGNWIDEVTAAPEGYQVDDTTITILSAEGMAWFAKQIKEGNAYAGKRITLANDIDLGAHYWLNWGLSTNTPYFAGEFDGDGHIISNLYAIATTGQGLFPEIKDGVVKNLKIQNVDFSATSNVVDACGVISPKLTKGTITNCHVSNGIMKIRSGAGGIVGATQANEGGIISYCSVSDFTFTLTASTAIRAGGIAGELRPGNVYTNCFVKNVNFNLTHTAAGQEFNVGGIAGFNLGGSIDHCCVRGFSAAFTATTPVIKIGTVVGSFNSGSVIQCYATENETYAHTGSGATADVTILADSQFNDAANFSELDFDKVWCIEEGNGLALQAASQFPAVFYAEKLNIQNVNTSGVIGSYNGSGAAISQQLAVSIPIGCNSVTISASPSSGATISGLPATVEFGADTSVTAVQTCEFTVSYSGEPDKTYRITMTRPKVLPGEGTEESPILVSSLEDLTFLSDNLSQRAISDAYVSLTADIDCQGKTITPVTSVKNVAGNQHTISNFTISDPYTVKTGLFKTLNENGLISDLYLENAHFSGGANSGLLVGTISEGASVTKCAVVNSEFLGNINHYNGLLFGTNNGTVSNCYVEGDTRKASNNILTGAIGGTNAGIVKNCYSDVYVKGNGTANNKGAFVHSNTSGQIINCIWNAIKISNCFDIGPASHSIHNGTVTNSAGVIVGNGSFTQQQVLGLSEDGLPQPMRDGYAFAGWYVTSISETVETFDRAKTYQARWTYTIDFNANGGTGEMAAQKITEGDGSTKLTTNGFEKTGYAFAGWNTQADGRGKPYAADAVASTVPNGTTLYAQWKINEYDVTFDSKGGSDVAKQTIEHGSKATMPTAPAKAGYEFAGWYNGDTVYDFSNPVTNDLTLTAKWVTVPTAEPTKVTVTFDSNGGSAVNAVEILKDAVVAVPTAPTREGYTFASWLNGTAPYNFNVPVAADLTLTAKWDVNTYTVTWNVDGKTTPSNYAYGTTITPPQNPTKAGYDFTGWSGYTNGMTMPAENVTFTAQWSRRSSAGGSSSSSTTTTTNKDGSTTTTTTNKTTGDVTETTKMPDGTTGTVVTDKNGDITQITASVSSAAAKESAKTGEAVTLPVEVPAVKATEDAPAVQITVPRSTGSVKVEIPVERVTPGTVAVIVSKDGTEKIAAASVTTEDGVVLTLDGSATVKVIDNSKRFTDVPADNVFYDEISALSAREIMVGRTDDKFDLYSSVTLNQIANVAGRITGAVDVSNFNAGVVWGAENGMKTGSVAATRGDVLKALYIAAGSPVVKDTSILARFKDAAGIPADLAAIAAWAAQNGILKGDLNGNANLGANVTRGQACALAGRTMGTLA